MSVHRNNAIATHCEQILTHIVTSSSPSDTNLLSHTDTDHQRDQYRERGRMTTQLAHAHPFDDPQFVITIAM